MGRKAESPYLAKAIENILLITQSLKKGIIDQHAVAQQAVIKADQAVMTCSSSKMGSSRSPRRYDDIP